MPPSYAPSLRFFAPTFPVPVLLPITEDKVSSRLTVRHSVWPFWISVSPEIGPPQMGQLSSADLRGEPFICLLMGGPCAPP